MGISAGVRAPERFRARYGPWAVVTGASSGIGRELAVQVAAAGVHPVLVARRSDVLDDLARSLSDRYDVRCRVVPADLSRRDRVDAVIAATEDLDVGLLIAAAGFGTSGPFLRGRAADELAMLDVNCGAVLTLARHFGARFADRGRGGIVLLSSIVAYQGVPRAVHYAATKAYVQTLAEGLHRELRPAGVDVLSAAPGPVHSGFADAAGMTMGRALDPVDVAVPVLNALGRRSTTAPGTMSKVLTWSLAPLPRRLRVRIMGQVMTSMTPVPAASARD